MTLASWIGIAAGSGLVGVLGGTLGVGGGLFLVPLLVWCGLRPVEAVGASLFCVIGTSAGASSVALRNREANLELALILEPALIGGAAIAGLVAHRITDRALLLAFAAILIGVALTFVGRATERPPIPPSGGAQLGDGESDGTPYRPQRRGLLALLAAGAGAASGLFGIGGGIVTVPLLTHVARVPVRAAAATGALSLMSSAGAAAAVHLAHGTIRPDATAAAFCGVLGGGMAGARLQKVLPARMLRLAFALLASSMAASLAWRALQGSA